MSRILIADDQRDVLEALRILLKGEGYQTEAATSLAGIFHSLEKKEYALLLMDLNYARDTTSGQEGLSAIPKIRQVDNSLPIVVMTAWATVELAVEAMKRGARDFVTKPWDNQRLLAIVRTQIELASALRRERKLEAENELLRGTLPSLIAESPAMRPVIEMISRVAPSDANILITGENGTGKSLIARAIHALSGIHLDIRPGEYISIAGPSGCGKTTLLSILGLLDTPSDGSYSLKGHEVANLSFADRARIRNREIGFIFQSFNLIGDLSVFENVELPLTYRGMAASERKSFVTEALERVGMAHRAKHLPSQLSGGQQQRVAVARALAGRPAILLADEPTGNLDSRNGEAVMQLLKELHGGGATICMVTHDERFAQHADRTVHLFDGRVVEDRIAA